MWHEGEEGCGTKGRRGVAPRGKGRRVWHQEGRGGGCGTKREGEEGVAPRGKGRRGVAPGGKGRRGVAPQGEECDIKRERMAPREGGREALG